MSALWLLAEPVWIFIFAAGAQTLLSWLSEHDDKWWAMPLWMGLGMPLVLTGILGFGYFLYLAVGNTI
jgi:hypothetical protein